MKKKHSKSKKWKGKSIGLVVLLTYVLSLSTAMAQETIPTSGGNTSGSGGTVSYSLGQVAYQTYTGTNGSVTEGVQQPYEIFVVTGLEDFEYVNLTVSAYPNPTSDILTLSIEKQELTGLSFKLFNINGSLLQNKEINNSQTTIAMYHLPSAVYFIKVFQDNKEVKAFKIIKN